MAEAQQYDPTATQPYQPVAAPEIPQPMPSPLPTNTPEVNGAVKPSGAIATISDGILRGIMQGRAMADMSKAMKTKAKFDNLYSSYNQDAQRLMQMQQAGVDPSTPEFKTAYSAVQGSWGAIMDEYGRHLEPDQGTKKQGKAKKAEQTLLGMFQSQDPLQMSQAWYKVARQAGPPVFSQLAIGNTPTARAQRAATQQTAQNQATAAGVQTQTVQHQQAVADAQAKIDELNRTPQSQWTPAMHQQYDQARQIVSPVVATKPGDEAQLAVDELVRRKMEHPDYEFTEGDKEIFRAAGYPIEGKSKIHITKTGEIVRENDDGTFETLRGTQPEYLPKGRGGAGGSSEPQDKKLTQWKAYFHKQYPQLDDDQVTLLAQRKVEGESQHVATEVHSDAIAEPRQFDNEVLTAAISRLRALPKYSDKEVNGQQNSMSMNFDDVLANIVGRDDYGYAYNASLANPRKDGAYSGNVSKEQLQQMDRDLQQQIRAVLDDPKNELTPNEKRAAMARMRPLFGPAAAPKGSGSPPGSPPGPAATAAASAQPSQTPPKQKNVVRKSRFLKANPGATDADWEQVKPQLKAQGYDTEDN